MSSINNAEPPKQDSTNDLTNPAQRGFDQNANSDQNTRISSAAVESRVFNQPSNSFQPSAYPRQPLYGQELFPPLPTGSSHQRANTPPSLLDSDSETESLDLSQPTRIYNLPQMPSVRIIIPPSGFARVEDLSSSQIRQRNGSPAPQRMMQDIPIRGIIWMPNDSALVTEPPSQREERSRSSTYSNSTPFRHSHVNRYYSRSFRNTRVNSSPDQNMAESTLPASLGSRHETYMIEN